MQNKPRHLFRLCNWSEWLACEQQGFVPYNQDDERDGFLHLSLLDQVEATANKYYTQTKELTLLGIRGEDIQSILKFERSPGGALFPHAYGQVPKSAVRFARRVPKIKNSFVFSKEIFS